MNPLPADDIPEMTKASQQLCEALRIGSSYEEAALFAGIRTKKLRRWMKWGKRALKKQLAKSESLDTVEQAFLEFYQMLKKARGDYLVASLAKMEKAVNHGDWRAAVWKFQRILTLCRSKRHRYPGIEKTKTQRGQQDES